MMSDNGDVSVVGDASGVGETAIQITSALKNREDGGASEMLQAVLGSPNTGSHSGDATGSSDMSTTVGERRPGWWSLLESATLQQNTEEFYTPGQRHHCSPRENWMRLERKAAKVGRGLSRDEKALKLGLQHWLEAIDPKHRYGHNLRFFYEVWIKSSTHEPFYYWLDQGEGKDIDLEQCSRSKLQAQLIKYLGPKEREAYEVVIEDGKLLYQGTREPVHTPKGDRWIFVMSPCGKLYVAKKEKGKFQHSSFLAGGVTTAAGRLLVQHGVLQVMEAHSGHYLPTPENFRALISTLTSSGADLTVAKVQLESEEEVAKRALEGHEEVGSVDDDNESAFIALLASAGFTIRSDTAARFQKSDSHPRVEDRFGNDSSVDEEGEEYDILLEAEAEEADVLSRSVSGCGRE